MKSPACCCSLADAPLRGNGAGHRRKPEVPAANSRPAFSRFVARASRRPAGVALITVLLIVFLASITATSLATLQQMAIRRGTVLQHQQQARLYALGAEQWAKVILARDREESETDHPGEEWANLPPALPIEGGALTTRIRDLQGCFNLNNLWRPASSGPSPSLDPDRPPEDAQPQDSDAEPEEEPEASADADPPAQPAGLDQAQIQILQRLLVSLDLQPALAQAIADWIDPDADPLFPDGAEDSDYLVLDPPYLAANRPMLDVSELRLVKGVNRETYHKLASLVCVLPPGTALNVNTAPALVLAALSDGLDPIDVERLLENRPAEGYENVDDFLNAVQLTLTPPEKERLSVASHYFQLRAEARVGDGRAMLYSILKRDENGILILQRSFGHQD